MVFGYALQKYQALEKLKGKIKRGKYKKCEPILLLHMTNCIEHVVKRSVGKNLTIARERQKREEIKEVSA